MLRIYGSAPHNVAVIHGGPGAPGDMAPMARELSQDFGVLEPLQSANSLDGQVDELKADLKEHGTGPMVLIGWSYGGFLSLVFAARYPDLIAKLILVGTGPFAPDFAWNIEQTRLLRLSKTEQKEIEALKSDLWNLRQKNERSKFDRFIDLLNKSDCYDAIPHANEIIEFQPEINRRVWGDTAQMRESGELLELARKIQIPVVAIHGDYDPHPAAGVDRPLSSVLDDFKFVLLDNCGHAPWHEKRAKDRFYEILRDELSEFAVASG